MRLIARAKALARTGLVAEPEAGSQPEGEGSVVARDQREVGSDLGLQAELPQAAACPDTPSAVRRSCRGAPSRAGSTKGRIHGVDPGGGVDADAEDPAVLNVSRASSRAWRAACADRCEAADCQSGDEKVQHPTPHTTPRRRLASQRTTRRFGRQDAEDARSSPPGRQCGGRSGSQACASRPSCAGSTSGRTGASRCRRSAPSSRASATPTSRRTCRAATSFSRPRRMRRPISPGSSSGRSRRRRGSRSRSSPAPAASSPPWSRRTRIP